MKNYTFKQYVENKESIPSIGNFFQNSQYFLKEMKGNLLISFASQVAEIIASHFEKDAPQLKIGLEEGIKDSKKANEESLKIRSLMNDFPGNRTKTGAEAVIYALDAIGGGRPNSYGGGRQEIDMATFYVLYYGIRSKAISEKEIYNIYYKLALTSNSRYGFTHSVNELPADVIAMIKAARENPDNNSMAILADKLEDHDYNNQEILAHMRDRNVKWSKNDWIFKDLLNQ